MTVAESWVRIESRLRSHADGESKPLPLGAAADEVRLVEAELGMALPDDVRKSYALHNGSGRLWICEQGFLMPLVAPTEGLLSGYGVLDLWRAMGDVGEAMAGEKSSPRGPILDDWWNRMWVPLTENECGDFVCLDLAPGMGGRIGQVIDWNHEQGATRVLAVSFREWLASLTEPTLHPDR